MQAAQSSYSIVAAAVGAPASVVRAGDGAVHPRGVFGEAGDDVFPDGLARRRDGSAPIQVPVAPCEIPLRLPGTILWR